MKEIRCWTEELITFCPFSPVSPWSWLRHSIAKTSETQNIGNIKHCGTNFVILNIFWKQKIVKTVWPVRVKSSVLASLSCNPVWDWVTIGTRSSSVCIHSLTVNYRYMTGPSLTLTWTGQTFHHYFCSQKMCKNYWSDTTMILVACRTLTWNVLCCKTTICSISYNFSRAHGMAAMLDTRFILIGYGKQAIFFFSGVRLLK